MADGEQTKPTAEDDHAEPSSGPMFTTYGVASAVLGAISVAAIALGLTIWSVHRGDVDERAYQSRVLRTAAEWTGVLINMNAGNVDASVQRLHDHTAGELNADFDAAMQPYRKVVQQLKASSTGRVEAVAIETVHHDPEPAPGDLRRPAALPPGLARRTDTVMVVATSVAENAGGEPQTVHWNLRLDVSDVDGTLLISRLSSIR
ncbi:hypothetical protein [Mycobacterium sp.]|uniref:hypothetical protein n=2 Tax=Mycobacterium sp. TaxID=1785 RepID=UPI0031DD3312